MVCIGKLNAQESVTPYIPVEKLPGVRCHVCLVNAYDFVCYDCLRPVCGDCSEDVWETLDFNVRVCRSCIEGEEVDET